MALLHELPVVSAAYRLKEVIRYWLMMIGLHRRVRRVHDMKGLHRVIMRELWVSESLKSFT